MPRLTATKELGRPAAPVPRSRAKKSAPPPDRLSARKLFFRRVKRSIKPGLWVMAIVIVLAVMPSLFRSIPAITPVASPAGSIRHGFAELAAFAGFRVSAIEVTGIDTVPAPVILAALGVKKGDPILGDSLAALQARVEQLGPVQAATVERALPGTLIVNVTERDAFAIWQQPGAGGAPKFVLIDKQGDVIAGQDATLAKRRDPALLLLAGDGAPQNAGTLVTELKASPAVLSRVAAAERVDGLRWNLTLANQTLVKLPADNEQQAITQLASLQASMGLLDRPVEVIDLRLPGRLIVRPYRLRLPHPPPPAKPGIVEDFAMNDMSRRPPLERQLKPPADETARPRAVRSGPFGVLDIGSTKIACMIGRAESDGRLRALGFGWQKGRGVKSGGIVDLDEAERAIRAAVGAAEDMADTRLKSVVVNLSCGQPESRLFNVQWPVDGRAVTSDDVKRVVREARGRAMAEGRETIHSLPLSFSADETPGVTDPRGLFCDTLTARLHVIDAGNTALRTLAACLSRCELDIAALVSAPMASGLAALVADERELGATVIDMGGGTTTMAVFAEGQVLHTAQLPIGGMHVTNDIARMLSTSVVHAERLKALYGNVQGSPDDERELLPVPQVGEDEHHINKIPRSMLISVIRPRMEEIFEMVKDRLETAGLGGAGGNRVVLTGGASQLGGVREMAAQMLERNVRLGRPNAMIGLPDAATGPNFATLAGLLAFATGDGQTMHDIDFDSERSYGWFGRFVNFLKERV